MLVWHDLDSATMSLEAGVGPDAAISTVVTIGNFDGVHRGHQAVLARVVNLARSLRAAAVAITFEPHPSLVHQPDDAPELLTGLADRLDLLAVTGLDATLVIPYSEAFSQLTPVEFVINYLVTALGVRAVVVGQDARFGVGNSGDVNTMAALGAGHGFDVIAVNDVGLSQLRTPGGSARWSSSAARMLLSEGDVAGAAAILGRPHRVRGIVVHGDARGRQLGFPTANLGEISGMVPAAGVYAGRLLRPTLDDAISDRELPAAISIGTNPTFDGVEQRVEAHVLDRHDLDLYGEQVVFEFVSRLRPTVKFDGVDALIRQMHDDADRARSVLARF